jgi:hypothetical protein
MFSVDENGLKPLFMLTNSYPGLTHGILAYLFHIPVSGDPKRPWVFKFSQDIRQLILRSKQVITMPQCCIQSLKAFEPDDVFGLDASY